MKSGFALCKFSATCKTDDVAVLHCLRALCHSAERHRKFVAWGGTGASRWLANSGEVTFRFTKPEYRAEFIDEAERLLGGHWQLIGTNNNDPAKPQK